MIAKEERALYGKSPLQRSPIKERVVLCVTFPSFRSLPLIREHRLYLPYEHLVLFEWTSSFWSVSNPGQLASPEYSALHNSLGASQTGNHHIRISVCLLKKKKMQWDNAIDAMRILCGLYVHPPLPPITPLLPIGSIRSNLVLAQSHSLISLRGSTCKEGLHPTTPQPLPPLPLPCRIRNVPCIPLMISACQWLWVAVNMFYLITPHEHD